MIAWLLGAVRVEVSMIDVVKEERRRKNGGSNNDLE